MKALVIDDDPIVCVVLVDTLSRLGFSEVLTAADGEDAVPLFKKHEADIGLVCSDLNMPGLDGVGFMDFMAERSSSPQVILVSGAHASVRKSAEILAKAKNINVIGSIAKPLSASSLETLSSLVEVAQSCEQPQIAVL